MSGGSVKFKALMPKEVEALKFIPIMPSTRAEYKRVRREQRVAQGEPERFPPFITTVGPYKGQPSSRERLAELIGRSPTEAERYWFARLRRQLGGTDPTREEYEGFMTVFD